MEEVIIVFGKPGVGKGTRLSEFLDGREEQFEVGSGSAWLKEEAKKGTEIGEKIKACMKAGELVPDEIIIEIVLREIKNTSKTMILDGFPRTVAQAEAMFSAGIYPKKIVELYVDDEVILERMRDRVVCKNCGEPYTLNSFNPPKVAGVCDKCGGPVGKRDDDNEETVKKRLKDYADKTYPIVDFFRDNGLEVHVIESEGRKSTEQLIELLSN